MLEKPFKEEFKIDGRFGEKRSYGLHSGEDRNGVGGGNTDCGYKLYPLKEGTAIHASEASTGYGNIVVYEIKGAFGVRYIRYCHCKEILVRSGLVKPGVPIATLGTTGNSTACHLHWDVIRKPMKNWRTYAKDKATLDEFFEDPTAFYNGWKDEKDDTMANWLLNLANENQIQEKDIESWVRGLLSDSKNYKIYYDKVQDLTEQLKTVNDNISSISAQNSTYLDKIQKLEGRIQEVEESLNLARSERNQAIEDYKISDAKNEALQGTIKDQEKEIKRLQSNNDLKAYTWFQRLFSLFGG